MRERTENCPYDGEHGCGVHCGPCDFEEGTRADCPYHPANVHARALEDAGLPLPTRVPEMPAVKAPPPTVEAPCCAACAEFEADMAAQEARQQARKAAREDRLREALAAYAHEAWAGWMRNQAALQLQMERKGTTVITWTAAEDYDRWARQMETPYAELPEAERASDRAQADRILAILRGEG